MNGFFGLGMAQGFQQAQKQAVDDQYLKQKRAYDLAAEQEQLTSSRLKNQAAALSLQQDQATQEQTNQFYAQGQSQGANSFTAKGLALADSSNPSQSGQQAGMPSVAGFASATPTNGVQPINSLDYLAQAYPQGAQPQTSMSSDLDAAYQSEIGRITGKPSSQIQGSGNAPQLPIRPIPATYHTSPSGYATIKGAGGSAINLDLNAHSFSDYVAEASDPNTPHGKELLQLLSQYAATPEGKAAIQASDARINGQMAGQAQYRAQQLQGDSAAQQALSTPSPYQQYSDLPNEQRSSLTPLDYQDPNRGLLAQSNAHVQKLVGLATFLDGKGNHKAAQAIWDSDEIKNAVKNANTLQKDAIDNQIKSNTLARQYLGSVKDQSSEDAFMQLARGNPTIMSALQGLKFTGDFNQDRNIIPTAMTRLTTTTQAHNEALERIGQANVDLARQRESRLATQQPIINALKQEQLKKAEQPKVSAVIQGNINRVISAGEAIDTQLENANKLISKDVTAPLLNAAKTGTWTSAVKNYVSNKNSGINSIEMANTMAGIGQELMAVKTAGSSRSSISQAESMQKVLNQGTGAPFASRYHALAMEAEIAGRELHAQALVPGISADQKEKLISQADNIKKWFPFKASEIAGMNNTQLLTFLKDQPSTAFGGFGQPKQQSNKAPAGISQSNWDKY